MCNCNNLLPIITEDKKGQKMVYEAICKRCFKKQKTSVMRLEEFLEYYINNK